MADKKTLTFAIMDAPYESSRSTTALRLMDIAARRGYNINVFAYEGAVAVPFARQEPHPNAVHGRDVEQENHPLPKDWVTAIIKEAERNGGKVDWVNCGLCVDERGVGEWVEGVRRGTPADLWKLAGESDNNHVCKPPGGELFVSGIAIYRALGSTIRYKMSESMLMPTKQTPMTTVPPMTAFMSALKSELVI